VKKSLNLKHFKKLHIFPEKMRLAAALLLSLNFVFTSCALQDNSLDENTLYSSFSPDGENAGKNKETGVAAEAGTVSAAAAVSSAQEETGASAEAATETEAASAAAAESSAQEETGASAEAAEDKEPTQEETRLLEIFKTKYYEAQRLYAFFNGYSNPGHADNDTSIFFNGYPYYKVGNESFDSMSSLEASLKKYFSEEIVFKLMSQNSEGRITPVFTEYEGYDRGLYYLGGYTGLWTYRAATNESFVIIEETENTAIVRVYAQAYEADSVYFSSYDYHVSFNSEGNLVFTDFRLLAETLMDVFSGKDIGGSISEDDLIIKLKAFLPKEASKLLCMRKIFTSNTYLLSYLTKAEPQTVCVYYSSNGSVFRKLKITIPSQIEHDSERALYFMAGAGSGEAVIIVEVRSGSEKRYLLYCNPYVDLRDWLDFKYESEADESYLKGLFGENETGEINFPE